VNLVNVHGKKEHSEEDKEEEKRERLGELLGLGGEDNR
jgi:hypothetical protein